ncbi:MAG: dihydrofolate synthase/folylpolyglutamate synthase [Myxococcota bacterium]|jgi:dihydrofolate synthase/folylpolyglutamate synthase
MVYLPHFPVPNKKSISDNSCAKILPILERLGNPQDKLPPTIHLAGTNGKGSTAAFLSSIFTSANYKVHIFTSPHLHHCNERIVISGNQIDDGYLYELLEEIRTVCEEIGNVNLNIFEGITLAAILAFSKNPADICIIETGMGGRVDATNVIDKKIATILTSISHDHEEYLGSDLFSIACEKSHIMRPNVPCFVAPQKPEALLAIKSRASELSAPLHIFDDNFEVKIAEDGSFSLKIQTTKSDLDCNKEESQNENTVNIKNLTKPALLGWHQYLNASLAISTILQLKDFEISQDSINEGLKSIKWISRLEKLHHKSLKKDDEIWIDGAHNQAGFEVLADWIADKINDDFENKKPKRNFLITGFTKNKAKSEFFLPFKDIIDFICAIRVSGETNPEEADVIVEKILTSGIKEVKNQEDLENAINFLINLDPENPCRIVICGSLYLARDFKK